eukprot:scaffold781_cov123-Isochrysis_galbana.AAC.1
MKAAACNCNSSPCPTPEAVPAQHGGGVHACPYLARTPRRRPSRAWRELRTEQGGAASRAPSTRILGVAPVGRRVPFAPGWVGPGRVASGAEGNRRSDRPSNRIPTAALTGERSRAQHRWLHSPSRAQQGVPCPHGLTGWPAPLLLRVMFHHADLPPK